MFLLYLTEDEVVQPMAKMSNGVSCALHLLAATSMMTSNRAK